MSLFQSIKIEGCSKNTYNHILIGVDLKTPEYIGRDREGQKPCCIPPDTRITPLVFLDSTFLGETEYEESLVIAKVTVSCPPETRCRYHE